ncbi:helix-turn-helix domain-containing protein [Paenibacillus piri]|uniref:AraC family transcriptional regulator n=1 Tax=Paenibacillus piri TaxID=2547395 RepID=A0A4R5KCG8_9BACL|nr:helix-turn-helix domain-containing protein [Paenibacillus piri]TDF91817.1 AraC family transcriptional regulator [Paenibacillus piri]
MTRNGGCLLRTIRIPKFRNNLLNRLIWQCCISICVAVIVVGTVYYQVSMSQAERQAMEQSQTSLARIKDSVESLLQGVENDSLQLAVDPLLTESFTKPDYENNFFFQQDVIKLLSRKNYFNSIIKEIIFYRINDGFLLSSEQGHIQLNRFKQADDIQRILNGSRYNHWMRLPQSLEKSMITFTREVRTSSDSVVHGFLIYQVQVSIPPLQNLQAVPGWSSRLYVIDDEKRILFGTTNELPVRFASPQVEAFLNAKDATASQYIKGKLYTFVKTAIGREYISLTPRESIANEFTWIRWLTALIVSVVLICGISVTLLNLKLIYNPIEQLILHGEQASRGRISRQGNNEIAFIKDCLTYLKDETDKIREYVSHIQPTVREKFLQMVLEWNPLIRHSIESECEKFNIRVHGTYGVIVIDAENLHRQNRFLRGDQPIIAYAVTNMLNELLKSGQFPLDGYVVMSSEWKAIAILHPTRKMSPENVPASIRQFSTALCSRMDEVMKIQIAVGIGRIYNHIADISVAYQEAKMALQRRIYGNQERLHFISDSDKTAKSFPQLYPNTVEKQMIEALKSRELLEGKSAVVNFSNKICGSENAAFISQCYNVLLASLLNSLQTEGGNLYNVLSEHALFEELRERQTSSEIHDWFTERFFPVYLKALSEGNHVRGKNAVMRIMKHIRDNALDNPSLVQCSEMVSMNPSYISHIFRIETGMSFVEFLTQCKLEESKKMLSHTDMNVGEIASKVGFSERHFLRVFQKHLGITPSQYRAMHR